jgi:phosphate transport system substrate-binding protein
MMKRVLLIVVALLMVVPAAFSAELKIEGGAPAIEKIINPIKEPFEKATGIKIVPLASGPKVALLNLEAGKIDIAMGPSEEDWLKFMAKEGVAVKDKSIFSMTIVGEDRIVSITNPKNPVASLTKDQIKGLYTGKIDNWKAVGGPDAPVIVVLGKLIMPAVTIYFNKTLDGEAALKDIMSVGTAQDVRAAVAANLEAIGIVSKKIADGSVKVPEGPEVPIIFTFASKKDPSPEVKRLLDFIRGEGKQYLK